MSHRKPILLVEDGHSEGPTVRQALELLGVGDRVVQSTTAAQALEHLTSDGARRPSVIVADASTQDADGLELLKRVKADEQLKTIPVIIVAPSSDVRTIDESFGLGVAGYVVKSPKLDEFVEAVRAVHEYWLLSESPVGR
ncbi:MAG: response regulator [Sedimentisphaerales bacterium]|nr:response regulator [Sedimentisphaerales bacterium]